MARNSSGWITIPAIYKKIWFYITLLLICNKLFIFAPANNKARSLICFAR
jgi:hypothetical protein